MRRLTCIFLVIFCSGTAYSQKFEGGILGGLTASQIDGDSYSGYNKVGLLAGAFVQRLFTYTLAGQMELRYVQKGSLHTNKPGDPTYYKASLHYIDIPIMAQYIYNEKVVFELGIGPEFLLSAKEQDAYGDLPEREPYFNTFTMSAIAGIGYTFWDLLTFSARFNYSIIPIRDHPSGQSYL
ncbi:MAG: PorT family protein, partial [Bacteroidales bacterium]|nr:PorT family protein [Bacteroidales bacterium]